MAELKIKNCNGQTPDRVISNFKYRKSPLTHDLSASTAARLAKKPYANLRKAYLGFLLGLLLEAICLSIFTSRKWCLRPEQARLEPKPLKKRPSLLKPTDETKRLSTHLH